LWRSVWIGEFGLVSSYHISKVGKFYGILPLVPIFLCLCIALIHISSLEMFWVLHL